MAVEVVVFGGDGTVVWVLNALHNVSRHSTVLPCAAHSSPPCRSTRAVPLVHSSSRDACWVQHEGIQTQRHPTVVAVQPLGTGNDMARHLNWGSGLLALPQAIPATYPTHQREGLAGACDEPAPLKFSGTDPCVLTDSRKSCNAQWSMPQW